MNNKYKRGNNVVLYRQRIYDNYVKARNSPLAPFNLAGLNSRAPYIHRIINRYFPQDRKASILDLGCGYGAILYFAREAGYTNVRGIERSLEQLEAANNLGIKGVEEGDLTSVLSGLENSSQDCIITFDVIEHFTREELISIVDDIFRALKANGCWIIHTPNGESPFGGRMRYWDITHEIAFTRTSLAQILLSSGFSGVQSFEDEPIPHGVKSSIRWLLWKITRNILRLYLLIETGDKGSGAIFSQNLLAVAIK